MSLVEGLQFKVLNIREPGAEVSHANSAHEFWKSIWKSTWEELKADNSASGDEFLSQQEVGALFVEDAPVGLVTYAWHNLRCNYAVEQKYFEFYPKNTISELIDRDHNDVMVMSYLSVHPEWRKSISKIHVSEILIGLAVKRFKSSKASALISFTRNDRKVNDIVYRHGAEPLAKNMQNHNVEVDCILIDKNTAKQSSLEGVAESVEELWNRCQQNNNENLRVA